MASAYAHAEDAKNNCRELNLLALIDRFGIEAVLGRKTFYHGELRCLITAENIYNAYQARQRSKNWADWSNQNPVMSKLLVEAELLCHS